MLVKPVQNVDNEVITAISVDCHNEIMCFGCVFINTIVENEFDGFGVQSVSCEFFVMGVQSVSCDMSSFSCYNVNVRSLF